MTRLSIDLIRTDGGTQPRARLNPETVTEYANAMVEDGIVFPSVTVFYDGADYWLADGFHRVAASIEGGFADIDADIRQGTRRDAVLFSVGANADHGLRRTNEDKRRAVLTLLDDEEWQGWSDREIARRTGVSNDFVSRLRPAICHRMTDADEPATRTVTRGGKTFQQNTSNIGKGKGGKKKPALSPAEPREESPPAESARSQIANTIPADAGADHYAVFVLNGLDRILAAIEHWPDPADAIEHLRQFQNFQRKLPVVGSWLARLQELEEARSAGERSSGATSLCLN